MQVYHFEALWSIHWSPLLQQPAWFGSVPNRPLIWVAALSFLVEILEVGLPSRVIFVSAIARIKVFLAWFAWRVYAAV